MYCLCITLKVLYHIKQLKLTIYIHDFPHKVLHKVLLYSDMFFLCSPFLCRGGRIIRVSGQNLDVVQEPKMRVTLSPPDTLPPRRRRSIVRRSKGVLTRYRDHRSPMKRLRRIVPEADCPEGTLCHVKQVCFLCGLSSVFFNPVV